MNLRAFYLAGLQFVVHSMRCKTSPPVEARVLIASGEW